MIVRPQITCLSRHALQSQLSTSSSRRHGSSRSSETYILPRLAIDLDAHDNPYVRPAKEEDYAVRPKPPRRQSRRPSVQPGYCPTPHPFSLDIQKVTAPDLLAHVLFGNPNKLPTPQNTTLRQQFKKQKILPLDDPDTQIKQLIDGFTTDALRALEHAGFGSEREELLVEELQTPSSFQSLGRMLTMLSSTQVGCNFLRKNEDAVVTGINYCRQNSNNQKPVPVGLIVKILNNLSINMQRKGVDIGPGLCNAVIYYASKKLCFSAIRKYLKHESYRPMGMAIRGMHALVAGYRRISAIDSFTNHPMNQEERRQAVLRLLTGWTSGVTPRLGEERQPCFAARIATHAGGIPSQVKYREFIVALGGAGAADALWLEWLEIARNLQLNSGQGTFNVWEDVEMFTLAFLLAEDSIRALEVLRSVFNDGIILLPTEGVRYLDHILEEPETSSNLASSFLETASASSPTRGNASSNGTSIQHSKSKIVLRSSASGYIQVPIQLAIQTRAKILWYWKSNSMMPTAQLLKRLDAEFLPENSETVLRVIDDLLVPGWVKFTQFQDSSPEDLFALHDVDWIEKGGVEGIAVLKDGEVLHFKPSTTSSSGKGVRKVSN